MDYCALAESPARMQFGGWPLVIVHVPDVFAVIRAINK
jgi:hypothetical protein